MDHVAIMKKSLGLTKKILSGQKIIESHWYKSRYAPWNKIKAGDVVYFKDSSEPVTIRAEVSKVMEFSDMSPEKIMEILEEYHRAIGIEKEKLPRFFEIHKDRKYCILIFLKNPQRVKPFEINKKGFGLMSAWLIVGDINRIKKSATG